MPATLTVFAGTANPDLASNIAEELGIHLGSCTVLPFPDGELEVELNQSVRGHDVYVIQSTSPPVEKHLLELVFLADACHRAAAARVTAIVPYFGYARQDRRATRRLALGARVLADMLHASPIHRLLMIDLHTPAIEGFFPIAVEHWSAVPILAEAVRPGVHDNRARTASSTCLARLAIGTWRVLGWVDVTRLPQRRSCSRSCAVNRERGGHGLESLEG